MYILILSALKSEVKCLIKKKSKIVFKKKSLVIYQAFINKKIFYIGIQGIGKKNYDETFKDFIKENCINTIIITGYCGGLKKNLKLFDVLSVENSFYQEDSIKIKSFNNFKKGNILTIDYFVDKKEKIELGIKYPYIDIIDMETYHIINNFRLIDSDIAIYSIKIITDTINTALPDKEFIYDKLNLKIINSILKKKDFSNLLLYFKFLIIIFIARLKLYCVIKKVINNCLC